MKFLSLIVEHIDCAGLGAATAAPLGDDGGEHGLEIKRRVHCLRHFAERAQFLDRAAKLIGALAQLIEQPRVLDGDYRLISKIVTNSICLSVNGRTSWRLRNNTPIVIPRAAAARREPSGIRQVF